MHSRRYERPADTEPARFWQVHVAGDTCLQHFGYVGTAGHIERERFVDHGLLERELKSLQELVVEQGYRELDANADTEAIRAALAPQPIQTLPLTEHPAFEAKLLEQPHDADAWAVYGDWLLAQGDPRGPWLELGGPRCPAQVDDDSWLGGLAPYLCDPSARELLEPRWQHGHIVEARVSASRRYMARPEAWELLAALLDSPASAYLERLWVGTDSRYQGWGASMEENLDALASFGERPALRELTVRATHDYYDISTIMIGPLDRVLAVAPRLRSLEVRGAAIGLEELRHPTLERVVIQTGGLPGVTAQALARAQLPAATHLSIYYGSSEYGCEASLADVRPLMTNPHLPALEHLGLCNAEFQDELVPLLAASPLLPRLRSLDLSLGTMGEAGARALIDAAPAFAGLECVDVSSNCLSEAMVARLRRALPKLRSTHQYPTNRYVSLSE